MNKEEKEAKLKKSQGVRIRGQGGAAGEQVIGSAVVDGSSEKGDVETDDEEGGALDEFGDENLDDEGRGL